MGKGISYRDPVGYNLATVAVAVYDNEHAKAVLAGYGYTEVSDAALETIRRNKPAELEKIRTKIREAEHPQRRDRPPAHSRTSRAARRVLPRRRLSPRKPSVSRDASD